MDDDRLRRELERRATRAAVPDFVYDVGPRLGSDRAQPARAAPWAPLAGLAGAAFLVVLLVIAWPRFGTGPASTASPIASGSGTHACGSVINQVYGSTPVYVVDSTGSVLSCAAEHRSVDLLQRDGTVTVQQVPSEPDQLDVDWVTPECRPERVLLDIKPNHAGYALHVVVDRTGPDGYECVSTLQTGHALVTLDQPIDPARVSADLVLAPDSTADLPKTVDCAAMAGSSAREPALVDHTGLVVGCSQVEARSGSTGNIVASNPTDFDSVRYSWLDQTCAGQAAADFEAVDGGYRFAVTQPSSTCPPGVPVAIAVDYQIPMPAELVTAQYAQPAPVLSCADAPLVTIVDEVGVVSSCAASQSAGPVTPADGVLIDNPGGDATALRLSWMEPTGSQCNYEVHLAKPGDSYGVQIFNTSAACLGPAVAHTVTLQLATPIPADQVTFWSIGGPLVSPPPSATPANTPLPTGIELSCGNDGTLVDATSLVDTCRLDRDLQFDIPNGLTTTPTQIIATWVGATCQSITQASLVNAVGGNELDITPQSPAYSGAVPSCAGGPVKMTLTLFLRSPLDGPVSAKFGDQDLPNLAAPSPTTARANLQLQTVASTF